MFTQLQQQQLNIDHMYTLTETEKKEMHDIVTTIEESGYDLELLNSETLNALEYYSTQLPQSLSNYLIHFKRNKNEYGTLLFRNLPIDSNLPETPTDGRRSLDKYSKVSELLLFLFTLRLGEPIGYADEKQGQLVHDICPVEGQEKKTENSGSEIFFTYHTEDAIHPNKPDYLSLICLRADHDQEAATETASIIHALELLPDYAIELLRKSLFQLTPPSSFNAPELSTTKPVLTGNIVQPNLCIHASQMHGISEEAQWALDELKNALAEVSTGVVLLPGDLIIIDNKLAAHARTAFTPRYDGQDRWLQRMFTIVDFDKTKGSRSVNSHVCMPLKRELEIK